MASPMNLMMTPSWSKMWPVVRSKYSFRVSTMRSGSRTLLAHVGERFDVGEHHGGLAFSRRRRSRLNLGGEAVEHLRREVFGEGLAELALFLGEFQPEETLDVEVRSDAPDERDGTCRKATTLHGNQTLP